MQIIQPQDMKRIGAIPLAGDSSSSVDPIWPLNWGLETWWQLAQH